MRATRAARLGGPASDATAAGSTSIDCVLNVQNPHNSSHVGGTVNVVARVTCTSPVESITVRAALYRNGALVKDSGPSTRTGVASYQNNAAVSCVSGRYQGWGSNVIQYPPGYTPSSTSGTAVGNAVDITC